MSGVGHTTGPSIGSLYSYDSMTPTGADSYILGGVCSTTGGGVLYPLSLIIDGADLVGSVIGSTGGGIVVEAGGGELDNTGLTLLVYQPRSDILVVEGVDPPLNIRVIIYIIPHKSRNHNNIIIIIITSGVLRFPYIAV